ncbi:Protein late bloomer [Lucilia cuprina]|nr:Protein late bloomer [Lucilia cuprina]KAI8119021.1 Protein late bloomer [Lucilia cuprina]
MYFTTKTYKIITISLNTICGILGILLTWYGIWLYQSNDNPTFDHGEKLGGILIITLGVVVLCVSIYGIVVAIMECKKMLIYFAVLLVVLIVIQFIMVSITHSAINTTVSKRLKEGFDELWDTKYQNPNATLSIYEEWLKCCGKNSAEDYFLLDKVPPSSCCEDHNCTIIYNLYTVGCEEKFYNYIRAKTNYFNILSWLLITVEFIGSIFACVLVDSIRNHRDRQRFYS